MPDTHRQEYQEQRGYFWDAQGLRRNLLDVLEDQNVFDRLKDDLYDGVIDTCRDDYPNGLKRMRATLASSTRIQLAASVITQFPSVIQNRHRKSMCHMLTNEGRLVWVEES
ncbi:ABC-three component system protein [Arcanobacterium phocae]|uniref:ABC-three component system protein n=1 Tax=Arcanobacterium phocae TaxID=131112 RepID=UPI001C0F24FB|nr:ABC-three component system protein [Arcanobacterium phocae]